MLTTIAGLRFLTKSISSCWVSMADSIINKLGITIEIELLDNL